MPLYYFILKAGRHTYPDSEGQEFPDEASAQAHAHAVAHDLMRNREIKTNHWRIQVCNDYLEPRYECLFADIDQTFQNYGEFRTSVAAVARTTAALGDALRGIDAGMADLRQILSRMDFIISSRPSQ
ncbi:DUF6894 family protein [Bradyrhizobium paxllaeri]|uniref:DUF6894 family protein n=1 Tax=Bradyrhizobium paxllaeri TaxID=190148 RepID=UPI0008107B72|nr:hypothetical protein [Bradyrhizobium paxllaeri]